MPTTASTDQPSVTKRRRPVGLIAVGVVMAIVVGYALWAGLAASKQRPLKGTVSAYTVTSDTRVDYDFVVTGEPGATVLCSVVARARDYVIVGREEHTLTLDSSGQARDSGFVTTLRRATNAEADSCQ